MPPERDTTLDDAAVAALWSLLAEPVERVGLLYDGDDNGVAATPTQSSGDSDTFKGRFRVPGRLRALYHNHPPRLRNSKTGSMRDANARSSSAAKDFSRDDIDQARRLGVPSYITADGGHVYVFDPVRNETQEVLAQFPWAEMRRRIMVDILQRDIDDARGMKR